MHFPEEPKAGSINNLNVGPAGLSRQFGLGKEARKRQAWRDGSAAEKVDPATAHRVKQQVQPVCQAVRSLTDEMVRLTGGAIPSRSVDRRRNCHARQIAMYICHVALGMTLTDIGLGFGRDRSTVAHACGVVEDRRDDRLYDEFIATLERIAASAVTIGQGVGDEG